MRRSRAILSPRVGDTCDSPLAIGTNEVEQVRSTVVDLAVDQELEGSPYHREIVIDAHQRIVNAFLNARGSWFCHLFRKLFEGHPDGLAVAHQDHRATSEQRLLDRLGIA